LNYIIGPDHVTMPYRQFDIDSDDNMQTGKIFDIKKYAIHNGPGIRTTIFCKACERVCPAEAVEFIGKTMSVEDVVAEITKDALFYDESSGGVTFSGGEPLLQPSFLSELLKACGDLDLHRAVDTCGYADTRTLLSVASHRCGTILSPSPGNWRITVCRLT